MDLYEIEVVVRDDQVDNLIYKIADKLRASDIVVGGWSFAQFRPAATEQ